MTRTHRLEVRRGDPLREGSPPIPQAQAEGDVGKRRVAAGAGGRSSPLSLNGGRIRDRGTRDRALTKWQSEERS